MERYEVHGLKAYQINICAAIKSHDECPGITTLKAGRFGARHGGVHLSVP